MKLRRDKQISASAVNTPKMNLSMRVIRRDESGNVLNVEDKGVIASNYMQGVEGNIVLHNNFTADRASLPPGHRPGIAYSNHRCIHDSVDGWAARYVDPEFLATTEEENPVLGRVSRYYFTAFDTVDETADYLVRQFADCNFAFESAARFNVPRTDVLRESHEKASRLRASRARRYHRRPLHNCNSEVRAYALVGGNAASSDGSNGAGTGGCYFDGRIHAGNYGNDLRPSEAEGSEA